MVYVKINIFSGNILTFEMLEEGKKKKDKEGKNIKHIQVSKIFDENPRKQRKANQSTFKTN